jgi:thiamine kinase-like enzyme
LKNLANKTFLSVIERNIGPVSEVVDISTGLKHHVYTATICERKVVIKLFSPLNAKYAKYYNEKNALLYFGSKGLSPNLIYSNDQLEFLVMSQENYPPRNDLLVPEAIIDLSERISNSRFSARSKKGYSEEVLISGLKDQNDLLSKEVLSKCLERFASVNQGTTCPSHGDYRINNLSDNGSNLLALDWENIIMADIAFDLSSMIASLQVNGREDLANAIAEKLNISGRYPNLKLLIGANYAIYAIYGGIYRNDEEMKENYLNRCLEVLLNGSLV